jgi:DNA-binding response OmpR family regulator
MVLESRGYEVVSAEGFTDAIEKCSQGKYDLIIIGHSIPHKDKQAIVREFHRYCVGAPVLALLRTGESQLPEATSNIESFDPKLVLAAVESILLPGTGARAH